MKNLIKEIKKIYKKNNEDFYSFAVSNKIGQYYNLIDRRIIKRRTSKFLMEDDLLIPVDIMVRILHNIMSMDITDVTLKTLSVDEELLNIMFTYDTKCSENNLRLIRISIRDSINSHLPEPPITNNHLSVYVTEIVSRSHHPVNLLLGQIFLEDLVNSAESLSQRIKNLITQKDVSRF